MKHPNEEVCFEEFSQVFMSLIAEFEKRFSEFRSLDDDLHFISEPHLLEPETMPDIYQIELLELSEDTVSRHILSQTSVDLVAFWRDALQYPILRQHARRVLTCFGSTDICESAFSHMAYIKNHH
jgi:hypothetical protein